MVGGLLRRQRREAGRVVSGLIDAMLRDSVGLDVIVRRLDIDAIVARLDIDEIVARLDVDAIVSRLDVGAIVARLDIGEVVARLDVDAIVSRLDVGAIVARLDADSIVARLDMNEVVGSLDFSKLADQVVEDVDLPRVIMQAAVRWSAVAARRTGPDTLRLDPAHIRRHDAVSRSEGASRPMGRGFILGAVLAGRL